MPSPAGSRCRLQRRCHSSAIPVVHGTDDGGVPVCRVRRGIAAVDGSLPRLWGVEHPGRGAHGAGLGGHGPAGAGRGADRPGGRGRVGAPLHRHRRARPGAGGRAGPRLGHPPRRGARDRQVHAPAPDGGGAGPGRFHRPLRVGRGVGTAGEAPGRAARCAARPVVVRLRHVDARPDRPPRPGAARGVRGRLDPVGPRPRRSAPRRAASDRCASRRTGSCRSPRRAASPRCSSVTSRRTGRWPGPACSSTSSTRCCPSRATATTRSGCSARSSTASAPPTIWASSR